MPRNQYMTPAVRTEQLMYEDIVIEALKMYGQEVVYLPREWQNYDNILGDDPVSKFTKSYELMMYIENTEGFDGEGDLFTKFGIELRDQATFVVARREWEKGVALTEQDVSFFRPREGDLIYLKLSKSIFQIMKVETETPFYQLRQLPTFRLQAELFESNGEDFDLSDGTLNTELETTEAYKVKLNLSFDSGAETTFNKGEIVETTVDSDAGQYMRGEVLDWNDSDDQLTLIHVGMTGGEFYMWTAGNVVTGSVSGATGTITLVNEILNEGTSSQQNSVFSDSANISFIDFSETNPFGDP